MVTSRLRPFLIIILVSISLWFVIIYMCLPGTNLVDQWSDVEYSGRADNNDNGKTNHVRASGQFSQQANRPGHHQDHQHQPNNHQISSIDLLYHEFNLHSSQQESSPIPQRDHELETRSLGQTGNQIDERVETDGQKLFSFNLLISNRIGLFRALPDSRHQECPLRLTNNTGPYLLHYKPDNDQPQTTISPSTQYTNTLHQNHRLPKLKASIIICYFNEAPSALLRTIYTVLRRSPLQLVEEILVIDDFSNQDYITERIKPFLETTALNYVSFHRTTKREGLIRARLFGVEKSKGDVLVFLDSHIEANVGWLEPLMSHLEENNKSIACPMIDIINAETLVYTASPMVVGGLTWALHFKWDSVPSETLAKPEDFVKPIKSPTMAGGLYAIRRTYFDEVGQYDPGMELWGGENVELSLRVWMCGGSIVVLSCSRVGHIFRKHRPYGPEPDQPDSLLYNTHRTARVWLDEHVEQFYDAVPEARLLDSGDIINRLKLRRQMKCNNFTWFISNVYPKLRKPKLKRRHANFEARSDDSDAIKYHGFDGWRYAAKPQQAAIQQWGSDPIGSVKFNRMSMSNNKRLSSSRRKQRHLKDHNTSEEFKFQIQLTNSELCIESRQSLLAKSYGRLVLGNCVQQMNYSDIKATSTTPTGREQSQLDLQLWTQTSLGDYRLGENRCLDLAKNLPLLTSCHQMGGLFQGWSHGKATSNVTIQNLRSRLCLGVERVRVGEPIIVTLCDSQQVASNSTDHSSTSEDTSGKYRSQSRPINKLGSIQNQRQANLIKRLSLDQNLNRRRPKDFLSEPLQISQHWNIVISQHQSKGSHNRSSRDLKDNYD